MYFRLFLIGLSALTVWYVCLFLYFRAGRRQALVEKWKAEGSKVDLDAYILAYLPPQLVNLHRRLILGVYVVPLCLGGLLIYVLNSS